MMETEKAGSERAVDILIAEDSPTQAEMLRHLLAERGYNVMVAANGKEALAAARQRKPALVISDIVMPEMDGYALCKAVKADPALKDMPVILLTSLANPQDVINGLQCGADNFVRKPYDPRYLLSRVEYIIANRELRKAEKVQMRLEIVLAGQKYFIDSERQQILDVLLSVYEEAVHLNRELEEANKELDAFSYSVSHDLRAPLRAMDGFSRILLKDHGEKLSPDAQRYLELISANTAAMGKLIDDLLAFSRLSRQSLRTQRVVPADLARQALADLQRGQTRPGVEISIGPLPSCDADPALLKQVFINLLSNALKFTRNRDPARIEIGWSDKDAEVVYFVKDNGAGFDMRYADKLFGVFQRLHRADEYEGTGAGLAIVQRIIHRHGGRIWAEAIVDEGATFYFTLGGRRAGAQET
jgi:signal transduction histidine kinase